MKLLMPWYLMIKPSAWGRINKMMKRTYAEALQWAFAFFKEQGREEMAARFLLCGIADFTQTDLMMVLRDEMPVTIWTSFEDGVNRHVAGEPIQYIIGYEMFYGRKFLVNPEVLIPRPETEELVEGVLARVQSIFSSKEEVQVLDMGTGSGAIAISLALEQPRLRVTAIDIAPTSLEIAERNAERLGARNLSFHTGDLFAALQGEATQKFDVIVSNPPYIPQADCLMLDEIVKGHEPMRALDGGVTGLDFYQRIIQESPIYLKPIGMIAFEVGVGQGELVQQMLMKQYPDAQVEIAYDINGKDRMVYCVRGIREN